MDFVEGRVFADPRLPDLPKHERRLAWFSFMRTMAALHSVDAAKVGLQGKTGFDRPGNYFQRQFKTWTLIEEAQGKVKFPDGRPVPRLPNREVIMDWLKRNEVSRDCGCGLGPTGVMGHPLLNCVWSPESGIRFRLSDQDVSGFLVAVAGFVNSGTTTTD